MFAFASSRAVACAPAAVARASLQAARPAVRVSFAAVRTSAPSALRSDLVSAHPAISSLSCSLAGLRLSPESSGRMVFPVSRGSRLVVRAGGTSIGCTKRHASRKKRARVSGYRARIATKDGLNVLKRRRARGRKVLVPQASSRTGKRA
ncbi:unnamed protein product [Closterium sp. Naga37s-1]|nr:unnamed protein product [Closterium sp. Naga37s-1]